MSVAKEQLKARVSRLTKRIERIDFCLERLKGAPAGDVTELQRKNLKEEREMRTSELSYKGKKLARLLADEQE